MEGIAGIPDDLQKRFRDTFMQHKDQGCLMSGLKARGLLEQSGLGVQKLGAVWMLSDMDGDGCLDMDEFAVAMFLIMQVKKNPGMPVPAALPPGLVPPAKARFVQSRPQPPQQPPTSQPPPQQPPQQPSFDAQLSGPPPPPPQPVAGGPPPLGGGGGGWKPPSPFHSSMAPPQGTPPLPLDRRQSSGQGMPPMSMGAPALATQPSLSGSGSWAGPPAGNPYVEEEKVRQAIAATRAAIEKTLVPMEKSLEDFDAQRARVEELKQTEADLVRLEGEQEATRNQLKLLIQRMEETVSDEGGRKEALERTISRGKGELADLMEQERGLTARLRQGLALAESAEQGLGQVKHELGNVNDAIREGSLLLENLGSRLTTARSEKSTLEAEARRKDERLAHLLDTVPQLAAEEKRLEAEVAQLETRMSATARSIEAKQSDIDERKARIERLRTRHGELGADKRSCDGRLSPLQRRVQKDGATDEKVSQCEVHLRAAEAALQSFRDVMDSFERNESPIELQPVASSLEDTAAPAKPAAESTSAGSVPHSTPSEQPSSLFPAPSAGDSLFPNPAAAPQGQGGADGLFSAAPDASLFPTPAAAPDDGALSLFPAEPPATEAAPAADMFQSSSEPPSLFPVQSTGDSLFPIRNPSVPPSEPAPEASSLFPPPVGGDAAGGSLFPAPAAAEPKPVKVSTSAASLDDLYSDNSPTGSAGVAVAKPEASLFPMPSADNSPTNTGVATDSLFPAPAVEPAPSGAPSLFPASNSGSLFPAEPPGTEAAPAADMFQSSSEPPSLFPPQSTGDSLFPNPSDTPSDPAPEAPSLFPPPVGGDATGGSLFPAPAAAEPVNSLDDLYSDNSPTGSAGVAVAKPEASLFPAPGAADPAFPPAPAAEEQAAAAPSTDAPMFPPADAGPSLFPPPVGGDAAGGSLFPAPAAAEPKPVKVSTSAASLDDLYSDYSPTGSAGVAVAKPEASLFPTPSADNSPTNTGVATDSLFPAPAVEPAPSGAPSLFPASNSPPVDGANAASLFPPAEAAAAPSLFPPAATSSPTGALSTNAGASLFPAADAPAPPADGANAGLSLFPAAGGDKAHGLDDWNTAPAGQANDRGDWDQSPKAADASPAAFNTPANAVSPPQWDSAFVTPQAQGSGDGDAFPQPKAAGDWSGGWDQAAPANAGGWDAGFEEPAKEWKDSNNNNDNWGF